MNETLVVPNNALDAAPLRQRRRSVPVVCFLIAMLDGYDTLMLSFIAPLISKEWGLGRGAFGSLFAAGYAGAMVGAVIFGMAADRFGRKNLLLLSMLIGGVFTILCSTASDSGELMLWRFLAGVGLGGAIPSISALTAEHAAPAHRSATVTRMFLGFPIGAVAGGAITASVMSLVGWRGVFVGGGVLSLSLLPIAFIVVTEIRGGGAGGVSRSERPFSDLVADGRLFGTVLICLSAFLILLVSYFLISWTPTVLTMHGMSPERAAVAGVVLNLGGVLGALAMSIALTGRSPFGPVALCLGIGGVLTVVLGQNIVGEARWTLALIFAVGAFVIGGQMNFPALGVHFYPEEVRATGVGLAMGVGRFGSIVGPLLGGYLVSAKLGWNQLFLFAGVPAVLAAAAMAAILLRKRSR